MQRTFHYEGAKRRPVREIEMNTEVGDHGLAALAPAIAGQVARGCRSLSFERVAVTDKAVVTLTEALLATTESWFTASSYRLSLELRGNPIGDVGVAELAKLFPYLHELDLSETAISDTGLAAIQTAAVGSHSSVREIELKRTRVSAEAVKRLREATHHGVKIDYRPAEGLPPLPSPPKTSSTAFVNSAAWSDAYDAIDELASVGHLSERAAAILRRKAAEDDKALGRVYGKYAAKFKDEMASGSISDAEAADLAATLAARLLELVPKEEL